MRTKYDNLTALVLGAGVSGEAAAKLLLSRGTKVHLLDECAQAAEACAYRLRKSAGTQVRAGVRWTDGKWDVCVASPGFAPEHHWIAQCVSKKIPLISELELGCCYWPGRVMAVTGSKGKSSLVKLLADTLRQAGISAQPAGNYGLPLSALALQTADCIWAIVEVSSFQMEHTRTFSPEIAILLNLQTDHLDRHSDMATYRALKLKMFANMRAGTLSLIPDTMEFPDPLESGALCQTFGLRESCDWQYENQGVRTHSATASRRVSMEGSWFDNPVLGSAAAAAVAALTRVGLSPDQIRQGFCRFQPLPHRMQLVATDLRGIRYIDDSKATSLTAMAAALKMTGFPVRLIAGGRIKEKEFSKVKELLTATVKKVYLIGECSSELFFAWGTSVECQECGTLEKAVALAAREAESGDNVLLSPGAASFDQFTGYRERGEQFTELVRAVANL